MNYVKLATQFNVEQRKKYSGASMPIYKVMIRAELPKFITKEGKQTTPEHFLKIRSHSFVKKSAEALTQLSLTPSL